MFLREFLEFLIEREYLIIYIIVRVFYIFILGNIVFGKDIFIFVNFMVFRWGV